MSITANKQLEETIQSCKDKIEKLLVEIQVNNKEIEKITQEINDQLQSIAIDPREYWSGNV